jgi:hypothetical protein
LSRSEAASKRVMRVGMEAMSLLVVFMIADFWLVREMF